MTIITKYSVGDEIWFVAANKVIQKTISKVSIDVYKDIKTEIIYKCADHTVEDGGYYIPETGAFKTKEELLQSL